MQLCDSGKLTQTDINDRKFGIECCVPVIHPQHGDYDSSFISKTNSATSSVRASKRRKTSAIASAPPTVQNSGETRLVQSEEDDVIQVPKDWRQFSKGGTPKGGYRAKGYFKYCLEARYKNHQVALFQCIPEGSTSMSNRMSLIQEYEVLVQASGLAKSFNERAKLSGVSITGLDFNAEGAFIGTTSFVPAGGLPMEETIENDERSLLYDTFLVVPLLSTTGLYEERKFFGNNETGRNDGDWAGKLVDAFAHHVVEHCKGEYMLADLQGVIGPDRSLMLFDPQAHTKGQDSGDWDRGPKEIEKFCQEHQCNNICTQMQLWDLSKPFSVHPFRPW
ncbi:hypothetical protein BT96DRAFT_1002604 [Gymnopus androsaceus JB14]|uniref:Alpha-type protein kinase domain-containing protein n=1 Tax=Gymnopus androsaceus JB14 TaxID=1447944 RepID=A0A6A4GXD5_9AGAR|nr:hypothetical protein BT96DRAFT_1002604 [Gymnopus androsaceus JB14]